MIKKLDYTLHKSLAKGNKACADGYFRTGENMCQFRSGNNIITIKEHFDDKATAEHLLENVICYEKNNCETEQIL